MSTPAVLLITEPSAPVHHLRGGLHVGSFLPSAEIVSHLSGVLIPVGIFDQSPNEFVVLEAPLELWAARELKTALPFAAAFAPRAIVDASWEGIDPSPISLVVNPLPVVVLFAAKSIPALAMLKPELPSALVNGLFALLLDERPLPVLLPLRELSLIAHSQILEDIDANSMVTASHEGPFIAISIRKVDYFACLDPR